MDARIKRAVAAARGVQRQRANHQCGFEHRLKAEQRVQGQGGGGLGAIDQRQPFLGFELQRADAGLLQGLQGRHPQTFHDHVALAH